VTQRRSTARTTRPIASSAAAPLLDRRTLNRTLLARQHLLSRTPMPARDMVEHLLGMQAQEPQAPYIGLWNRLAGFRPEELSKLIADRHAVRGWLMRGTIHLASARDYSRLWPLMRPVLAGAFRGSPFSKALGDIDLDALLAAGRDLLTERPCTRAELSERLSERWPDVDSPSLAFAVNFLAAVLQLPPRGLWRQSGPARLVPAENWLQAGLPQAPDPRQMIRRYLIAFGPATVADVQAWSGLTRLRPVIEELRPELRKFADEDGNELLDVPGAPLCDAGTPAPARLLAPFDNVILAHADRRRIIASEHRGTIFGDRLMRAFLIDGFVAGTWRLTDHALEFVPIGRLRRSDRAALTEEAQRLLEFLAESEPDRTVRFVNV
jgi:Winged helix DNA-binding domain